MKGVLQEITQCLPPSKAHPKPRSTLPLTQQTKHIHPRHCHHVLINPLQLDYRGSRKTIPEDQTPHVALYADIPTPTAMGLSPKASPKQHHTKMSSPILRPQCPNTLSPHSYQLPQPLNSPNQPLNRPKPNFLSAQHIHITLTSKPLIPTTTLHSQATVSSSWTDAKYNWFLTHLTTINDKTPHTLPVTSLPITNTLLATKTVTASHPTLRLLQTHLHPVHPVHFLL